MKNRKLSWSDLKKHRVSIFLILISIIAIGAVHILWVAPTMEEGRDVSAKVKQLEELNHKYDEKLSKAKNLKKELEKQEQELKQLQQDLFQGSDPYQLAANLAEPFSEGSQDLDIRSYQVVSSKEYGLYQEVKLRFSFTTTINGLYQFLTNIQKKQPAVLVQELDIRSVRRRGGSNLVVNLIVAALMEKGGRS